MRFSGDSSEVPAAEESRRAPIVQNLALQIRQQL